MERPRWIGRTIHALLVLLVLGVIGYAGTVFFRAAAVRESPTVSSTMEAVDWSSPDSSSYCLACHRPVGPASASLDVAHGHPQNVRLNDTQLAAVKAWGTVAGQDGALICTTCHILGETSKPYMLADTLEDGKFCAHCHPNHGIDGTPHDLRLTAATEKNRLGQTVSEGGSCSACHLAHRFARDFEPCVADPDGRCTTCHDADQCASRHARTTMEHTQVRCQDCHNPHDMSHGEFLKAPVSELCTNCHTQYADGTSAGMHPIAPMPNGIPPEILAAGGWTGNESPEVTCTVCHKIHLAEHANLLVLEDRSNELCLACHAEKRGPDHPIGVSPLHGQAPTLGADQRAVAERWGTQVGDNGELLCVTCHKVHGSNEEQSLLAFAPKYGEVCADCHPQHNGLFGTVHDLRTLDPEQPNRAGMTPIEYGACSACHLAHGFARETVAAKADPSGQCVCCHRADACASETAVTGVQHPGTSCVDCHNPHARENRDFLALPEDQLCADCHLDHMRLVGGPHDVGTHPKRWPVGATSQVHGPCTTCHVPHGGERGDLFRVHGTCVQGNHDDVCLVCHPDADWGSESNIAAIHPQEVSAYQDKVRSALVPHDDAGNLRMGCRTCHDPHGGDEPVHLARVAPGESTQHMCLHCHEVKQYINQTGHSAESLARFGYDVDSCKPCHAMHAKPDGTFGLMLSPRFLTQGLDADSSSLALGDPCLFCHHENSPAPVREIATHPRVNIFNRHAPDAPGFLPLFNDAGMIDDRGHIVCRTCHVSHGRLDLLQLLAKNEALSPSVKSAMRAQLRTFEPPNLCTDCHGEQARLRFLFFHDAERRSSFVRANPTAQSTNDTGTTDGAP